MTTARNSDLTQILFFVTCCSLILMGWGGMEGRNLWVLFGAFSGGIFTLSIFAITIFYSEEDPDPGLLALPMISTALLFAAGTLTALNVKIRNPE